MAIKFETRHFIAIGMGMAGLAAAFTVFKGTALFIPLIAICLGIAVSQHIADFFEEAKRMREVELKFPDFVRNLVSAIKSGMPMSLALISASKKDYGSLSPHVTKLANQVEWSIPIHRALSLFAKETGSPVIQRSISTVIEAEMSGGNIEDVLDTITTSVIEIKNIKEERKAQIHGQLVQSYIIFIVFIGVMIVIQNFLMPYIANLSGGADVLTGGTTTAADDLMASPIEDQMAKVEIEFSSPGAFFRSIGGWLVSLRGVFLMLALIQGLFAGLVLGKLSEGEISAGYKHSLILMSLAFFTIGVAQTLMG